MAQRKMEIGQMWERSCVDGVSWCVEPKWEMRERRKECATRSNSGSRARVSGFGCHINGGGKQEKKRVACTRKQTIRKNVWLHEKANNQGECVSAKARREG